MIKKFLSGMVTVAGFGAGALAASLLVLGNRRVDEWETLTLDDVTEGDFVTLANGTRMHYIACGDPSAEPIILIHGLMDSAFHWHKNIDALAQYRRVYAIDLPGFGYSSRVDQSVYCLDYFANAIRQFMDDRNIERADVIGHSLGGAVTLQLAHDYPSRVNKLILIAPGTYLTNLLTPINMAARIPFAPRALMGFALTSKQARMRAWRNALGDPENLDPVEFGMRVRPQRVKGTANALVAMASSCWTNTLHEELHQVVAPTLIVWGDKDRSVPPSHAERHANALPNAKLVILDGAGHIPQNEFPEEVNQLMLQFLID